MTNDGARLRRRIARCLGLALVLICGTGFAGQADERSPVAGKAAYQAISRREANAAGLPVDVADAVMAIESGYDPTRIGGVGEIGLMQVRPGTAAMLGFVGSNADLAKPEVNIHYGVMYLARAWLLAKGDFCRTLMKYRAGHGEEVMSPLSVSYCARARTHLALAGSTFAAGALPEMPSVVADTKPRRTGRTSPADRLQRIRSLNAAIERRWRTMAGACRAANDALERPLQRPYAVALRRSRTACSLHVALR